MFTPALYQDHRRLRLLTFIGVNDLHCDGSVVSGRFNARLSEFSGEKDHLLVERFVNWPDNENASSASQANMAPCTQQRRRKRSLRLHLRNFVKPKCISETYGENPRSLPHCLCQMARSGCAADQSRTQPVISSNTFSVTF
jgi:hypothetical protein